MKIILVVVTMFLALQSEAFAASLSCWDTTTFAYGRAKVTDNGVGKTDVDFSSIVLFKFIRSFDPAAPVVSTQVQLTFDSSMCNGLSV